MPKHYWLVKQEPTDYSWDVFVREGGTAWTGIRNFQARNHLREMKTGDLALFYHSGDDKQIVGIATVTREAYPDPTAKEGDWATVDLKPVQPLKTPITLAQIKEDDLLKGLVFVRQSRLSVSSVTLEQFKLILGKSGTRLVFHT
jgi:predicted RNA-binding protein with PUA-like domain